jgi:hypothetical protein
MRGSGTLLRSGLVTIVERSCDLCQERRKTRVQGYHRSRSTVARVGIECVLTFVSRLLKGVLWAGCMKCRTCRIIHSRTDHRRSVRPSLPYELGLYKESGQRARLENGPWKLSIVCVLFHKSAKDSGENSYDSGSVVFVSRLHFIQKK